MKSLTMAAAIAEALAEEMERDERVFVLGEDVPDAIGKQSDLQPARLAFAGEPEQVRVVSHQ